MKPYILANTQRRKGKKGHEKAFWKLANNSVFGKTMESVRGRKKTSIAVSEEKFDRHTTRPNWSGVHENSTPQMAMSLFTNPEVKLDKPIYTGQCILDSSKAHMYSFHSVVKERCPGWTLMYQDTDSFMFDIKTESFQADCERMKDWLDHSMLPKDSPLYTEHNAGVLGKFTDEKDGASPTCKAL